MNRLNAAACLFLAMALTGANVPIGKAIVTELPIWAFIVFRFAVAGLALSLLLPGEPGRRIRDMSGRDAVDLLAMALVGSVLFTALVLEGVRRTSAIEAGIIMATLPAVAAVLGLAVYRELPRLRQTAAIGLAVAGLIIMQSAADASGTASWTGNALVGLAVLCEALFVLISRRMSARLKPVRLSLAVSLVSLAFAFPFAAPELLALDGARVSAGTWALATWYALSSSVVSTVLWYRGAPHVETWLAGLATAALPVTAVAVSAWLHAERLGPGRLAGAGLVIGAIVVGALSRGTRHR